MPPYTEDPLGAFLMSLGQGIPAIAQAHRAQAQQDVLLAQQKQQLDSRLKSEALQQQVSQDALNQLPVQHARESFKFSAGIDPVAAIMGGGLKGTGVEQPTELPLDLQNKEMQEKFQSGLLKQIVSQYGLPNGQPQSSVPQATPVSSSPASQGAPPQGGPAGFLNALSFPDQMRFAGMNVPKTSAEEIAVEGAKAAARNQATPVAGPEAQDLIRSTQLIPSLSEVVKEARGMSGGADFLGQLGSTAKLGVGDFMYKHMGMLPPDALGGKYHNVAGQFRARAFVPFATGTRNAQFLMNTFGPHIIEGTDSPQLALTKAQDMASLFADQFDSIYKTTGKPAPPNPWRQFLQENFGSAGFNPHPQQGAPQGAPAMPQQAQPQGADMLKAYADQFFGGDLNAARQAATQSIMSGHGN